ncbi:hypothetical protein [Gordonia sp. (in: high G+C Gram-positive bacteria)]|jgi:hypothetical protein|uniref:hypothetical protein n=1 Tax=Gordonia sp. (in: high G+C Gram-positive bacteria) TaxID=84139 RepID=UPI0025BFD56A|nr:hypothetical protein [Gordonia sp. (in: high G+C Gram-positive bacteria)]HMS73608.1 hypothetical protein [Gordonia sp. (in: high G+C Gram-positive bacteria)]
MAAKKKRRNTPKKRQQTVIPAVVAALPEPPPTVAQPDTFFGRLNVQSVRVATAVAEVWSMPSVVFDRVMLGLLTCAAIPVGLLSAGFAPQRFFGEQIPVVAVLVGLTNLVLLWLASGFSRGPGRVAPLIAWLLTLMVAATAGPGRDVVLPLDGTDFVATFLLVAVGAGIPLAALWSGRLSTRPR